MRVIFILSIVCASFLMACQSNLRPETLPILGNKDVGPNGDTIYHTIPDFSFIDQDSQVVNNASFAGKAYVADFFFIACPTICPKTSKQMLRIHDHFKDNPNLLLLAHSVAPKYDTVAALNRYARNLGVESKKWHFVTGDQAKIYEIAGSYFSIAQEDPTAPGGFDHSGRLILVDKNRHVRSFCDGTDPEDVDRFMLDIQTLLNEK
ncbi:MAG: SCO family protein [Saprospiraceae bacterium]|nr:SCO family protein [Saprospiraceae bacterium]